METSEPIQAKAEIGRLNRELRRVIDRTPETAFILKYGVAVLSVTAALIIALWMESVLQSAPHVSLFLCAIILTAWFGGVRAGLLAIALSLLAFAYMLPPTYSLTVETNEIPRLLFFALSALVVGSLSAAQRSKAESLRHARDVLDGTVEELKRTNEALRTENSERTQAEDELRRQKEILQQIFDRIPVMLSFVGADGRIKLVNREWERTLGWSLEEIEQQNLDVFAEFYPDPKYRQEVLNFIAEAKGEWFDFKTRVRDRRVIDTAFVRILLSDGTSIGIGQDITERKRTEEALRSGQERYRKLSENFPNGAVITYDTDLRVTFIAGRGLHEAGFSPDFFIGKLLGEIAPPEVVAIAEPHFRAAFGGQTETYECPYPDGRVYFCAVAPLLNGEGLITEIQVISQDITRPRQAEEALRASEEQFRQMAENIREVFWLATADLSKMLYISPAYEVVWGQSCESLYREPRSFSAAIHEGDRSRVVAIIERDRDQGFEVEYRVVRPDGSIRWIRDRGFPIKDESGRFYRVAGIAEDITERKYSEEQLKLSKTQLAEAQHLAHIGSWDLDLSSKTVTWSDELYRIFGVQPSEFDHNYEAVIGTTHPDDRDWLRSVIEDAVNTHKPFSVYYRITQPAGEVRVLHARGAVATDEHGNATRLHGTAQDVTERKQAEDELRQQKEILQQIFDHIPLMISFVEADGRIKLVNREWERALGWSLKDLREQNLDVFAEFYPDPQYRQEVLKFVAEANGKWSDFKTRVRDGRVIDTTFVRVLLSDRTSIGIGQDITEGKQAEEARREAERKYKDIFENAGEGIFQSTPDGRYIAANPALARMYGFASPEELIHSCQDISRQVYVDPARREEFKRRLEEQGVVRGFEFEVFRKDGSTLWITVNARAVKDEQGAIQYYEGTGQDITARKIAEHGLRESEERYRELFENARDATYVHDLDGRYTSVNRAAEKLSGYTRAEILGKTFTNFVAPEDIENIREQLCRKLVDEAETSYETEVITKDGRRVAVEVSSHIILENGIPVGVQGTARDIAERKAGEEKLKANSDQLRALSARLQSAREEEGTRIAREIHDELGSALTALKWDLEEMDKMLLASTDVSELARLREKVQAPIKLADSAISAIRRIASELRPSVLDDLGLVAAIEWEAQQFQGRTGIACHCDCSLENVELSEKQSTAVFRIFQEALTNILRHAQATSVHIKIEKENGCFVLSVSDNGKGINEREKSEEQSLGILGMRERAQLVGGVVEINGVAGKGTVVIVRVPTSGDKVLRMRH